MLNKESQISFFENWINSPNNRENITHIKNIQTSQGEYVELPSFFHEELKKALQINGFTRLFSHQYEAINFIYSKKNVAITSGPSSGKSLIYLLPVMNDILSGIQDRKSVV